MNFFLSFLLFFSWINFNNDIPLTIKIDELRSYQGDIRVYVYLNQESFKSEAPFLKKVFPKKDYMQGEQLECSLSLPQGIYGIAILDDENSDGDMNYNFLGMPKEGYGFSNFVHKGFSRPVFSDFEFSLTEPIGKLNIELRYF